ncbi:unnamed protein product [Alopecurus aequalis]
MPRRPATKPIDDDTKRATTFNKLRREIFKEAAELSILTGARIAVVLEAEDGKVYSFGTPSAESVIDEFLSGNPYKDLGSEKNANMTQLQSDVVESERALAEVKEMNKSSEKVHNESPQVQVAPHMPPSQTSPLQFGSSMGWESSDADGGYGHDVGSSRY